MKNMKFKIAFVSALFRALWTAQTAFAWYDPSAGRWLTRDPIGEPGFRALQTVAVPVSAASPTRWLKRDPGAQVLPHTEATTPAGRWINRSRPGELGPDGPNLYAFVRNSPVNMVDVTGLTGWQFTDPFGRPLPMPTPNPDREGCVMRCIQANGGGWALAALGVSTVGGGTIPKPFGAGALGSGCCTTVPSLVQHFTGIGLRELGRKLNPPATAVQCAAAGYLIGASLSCNAECGYDVNAY